MDENMNNMPPMVDDGLDMMALAKQLWEGKKTVIIWTCVFMVLGLVSALTMKRTYQVTTMMVPQVASKSNASLSSLAALAGVDLTTTSQTADLSPIVYPQIVSSVPFQLDLMYAPLHYSKADTAVSMMVYYKEYAKATFFDNVKKYTIGLPGVILGKLKKEAPEIVLPAGGVGTEEEVLKPIVVTKAEEKMLKSMGTAVSLLADKKEGTLTLTVNGIEPIQTAELAMKAQQLLQDEITRFRTEKAQNELNYIQARYDEVKAEAEASQVALANVIDRTTQTVSKRDLIERERVQAKYNLANSLYTDMAKQLEAAKMQVKKDTPTFTVIQPVKVPMQPSNSRAKKLVIFTFFGFVIGCGIVLGKGYLPKLKEMFAKAEE